MKRVFVDFAILLIIVASFSSCIGNKGKVVGKWVCELYGSEQIIEFTEDGSFIDHTSGSVNRYTVSGGKIVTYVEDVPESKIAIEYKVSGDTLVFGNAEYKKLSVSDNR